jgi:hypothetical protein
MGEVTGGGDGGMGKIGGWVICNVLWKKLILVGYHTDTS